MKIGDEVSIHGFVDEIRKDLVIIRNDGGYFGTIPDEIQSKNKMSRDDVLQIGLAINAIATLTDNMTLAKIEPHLRKIEDITLKYVQEAEKNESSK